MSLLTPAQRAQLLTNGRTNAARNAAGQAEHDFIPVVKLFTPDAGATWLLTELDPGDEDMAFGLCDLGLGCPEIGYVSLSELATVRGRLGLPVECDRHFGADKPLSAYATISHNAGRIVT
jgi:hypothetical protein